MAVITSSSSGNWDALTTWAPSPVPVDGDSVVVSIGDAVDFNVDQSGFASGLAGLNISGTLRTDDGADRYLKCNADIVGVGDWFINDGAGGDWPSNKQMTIDLGGGSNSITSGNLTLDFRCAEPSNQYVRLSASASAMDTELPVDRDVTGDKWKAGDTVWVCNINNARQVEKRIINAINPGSIEITVGLTNSKLEGSYIILQNRNIRAINSTDFAIKSIVDSNIGIEISDCPSGGYNGPGRNTIYGSVGGGTYGALSAIDNTFAGVLVNHTYGLRGSKNCITSGLIAGSANGLFQTFGDIITGSIIGCTKSIDESLSIVDGGSLLGNSKGIDSGIAILYSATLSNSSDLYRCQVVKTHNTLYDGDTEFDGYANEERPPWAYCESIDHDKVPGAFKAWTRGGIVTHDTGVKPPGETQSYKHACESATEPVFKQDKILIQPGDTFVYAVDARKDTSMSFLPRAQLLLPEEDPLVDDSNTPLDEAIMTNSIDTWEELALTYENTTDYPVEVLVRTLAMNGSGNAWFLVEGGKFTDVVDVAGSTLDAVANDGTGTSATLTITPPASGLYTATKTRYRKVNDSDWIDGGDFVGTQGVQGTHQITGLYNNTSYEFFVVAHFDTAHSFPSDILRRWITDDIGPISEQILDDIKSSIQMVTTGNGYASNIESGNVVRREGTPWTKFECYPAVDVWLVQNIKTDEETMGYRDCHMEVEIRAYVYDGNDIDQALSIMAADIEKALAVDHTRGGNAIDTDIDEVEHIFADDSSGKPNGMVIITLDVKFWHLRNDPYD